MKKENKKHSVWLSESAWTEVESRYRRDNCSTRNEFIEKAIRFYSGYLDAEHADEYLPRVLADVLEGKLGAHPLELPQPRRGSWRLGENLYLACTALGLGTCGIGAYDQKLCDKTFQLDGEEEFTLYTQSVGTVKDEDEGKEKAFYSFVEEQGL